MSTTQKQQKKQTVNYQNPIEAFRDLGKGVVEGATQDAVNDMWAQLLGTSEHTNASSQQGELAPGQEISFKKKQEKEKLANVDPGINYRQDILHGEKRVVQRQSQEIHMQIQEILVELKKLANSSKELQVQFKDVAVAQQPVIAGKYHKAFYEWVLITIRTARMRIEDSANWLAMFQSKKKQKGYWQQFKKHGTSFGL